MERIRLQFQEMPNFDKAECIGATTIMIGGMMSSQMMIGWVAVDRSFAILKPMKYHKANHFKFAVYCSLFTFVFCVISLGLMFVGVELDAMPAVFNAGASWTAAFRVYWIIFNWIVGASMTAVSMIAIFVVRKKGKAVGNSASTAANQLRKQASVTKTIIIVWAVYILSYAVPNGIYSFAALAGFGGSILGRVGPYIGIGAGISSSANVFIYSLKIQEFRICLAKLFRRPKAVLPLRTHWDFGTPMVPLQSRTEYGTSMWSIPLQNPPRLH